ncbi:MAG: DUF1269 domain-containing protein, partial [Chloroflexi bacterium]|nr:DUF1269 domain-containing protein [Chloroflexota bacterium]
VPSLILTPGVASLRGRGAELGIEPGFERRLATALPPGSSAVILTVASQPLDRIMTDLHCLGGTLCVTPLAHGCAHEAPN